MIRIQFFPGSVLKTDHFIGQDALLGVLSYREIACKRLKNILDFDSLTCDIIFMIDRYLKLPSKDWSQFNLRGLIHQ